MPLTAGQVVNERYRIARPLGEGGMGAVYRAWDLILNIPVALKEMLPANNLDANQLGQLREQFRQEARMLAGLQHPSLPRVTDFFVWSGNDYLVMDFVEGESLATLIERNGALPEPQVIEWGLQLLDALATAHRQNILHRDIKPQNIIIRSDSRAVLVDFGLVKLWDPTRPETQRIIRGMGTREYASPEQFGLQRGSHTEPRSDIYSLGATLYHALTGHEPPSAMERLTGTAELIGPRTLDMRISSGVEAAVTCALALQPQQRYATVEAMTAALRQSAYRVPEAPHYQLPLATPPPPTAAPAYAAPLPQRTAKARPTWVLTLTVGIFLALVAMVTIQAFAFPFATSMGRYVGLGIGAVVMGALGWFAGDFIFESIKPAAVKPSGAGVPRAPGSPTQRLVMSTRRLMRQMTPAQQGMLLGVLVVLAILGAWLLGPVILRVRWLWDHLPSWAIAAPLAYAATGRRQWLSGMAHVLVAVLGGLVLRASAGTMIDPGALIIAAIIGGALVELCVYLTNKAFFEGAHHEMYAL